MEKTKGQKTLNVLLTLGLVLILAAYAYALVKIVLAKYGFATGFRELNLIPLRFLREEGTVGIDVLLKNVLGNVALFVPLGVLVPALSRRPRFFETLLFGVVVSLCFEALQYAFSWGATDIDDLILNTLGTLVGAFVYFVLFLHKKKYLLAKGLSFLFLVLYGVACVLALWLYSPDILPAVTEQVHQELVADLETDGCDAESLAVSLTDGVLTLAPGRTEARKPGVAVADSCPLSDGVRLYAAEMSYQYSPNGNIQKTETSYVERTQAEITALLSSGDGNFVDLWLDADGRVAAAVFTVFEDR